MYFDVEWVDDGGVSGRDPAIERMTMIEGSTMTAQQVNGRGSATVTDLQKRRAGGAVASVSARVHLSGPWTIVEVEGEMDMQAVPLVADLVGSDAARVVFDLRDVTFMDASGLRSMVDTQRRALEAGWCVRLVAPSSSARRLLMLTGCDGMFLTFDSLDQAVSASGLGRHSRVAGNPSANSDLAAKR